MVHRYERELEGGSRPPLRLITTQDAPSTSPMILCVSDVIWDSEEINKDGNQPITGPRLEVSDGWYKLRCEVDEPLLRAIERGKLRVGMKIAVSGARVRLRPKLK